MGLEEKLQQALNLLYEALLDDGVWPEALNQLADAIGVPQLAISAFDRRDSRLEAIAPRFDPLLHATYRDHWVSKDPLWPRLLPQLPGEPYSFDSLVPRAEFVSTDVYNEWYRQAKIGPSTMCANLRAADEFSATVFAVNGLETDNMHGEQALAFKAALPHLANAVRIHRKLRVLDLGQAAAPGRLEAMAIGVLLVDGAGKVLFANAWARALLTPGSGLAVKGGYLFSTDRGSVLRKAIASCCACKVSLQDRPGGTIALRRTGQTSLRVSVMPLRAHGMVAELPWLGVQLPVAMVTVDGPAKEKRLN